MTNQEQAAALLDFFKTLADANRLKIIGLLAQKPLSVGELATALSLSEATTSHHLARLSKSSLVSARAEGHFSIYSLDTDQLSKMSQLFLRRETIASLAQDTPEEAFERKVMKAFVDSDGRITSFPSQEKKQLVLLRYTLSAFEHGRRYTEKEVNDLLSQFNSDTATLRRDLVGFKMMVREGGGGEYWRL